MPMHIKPFRHNRKDVCIDIGMVRIIKKLWGNHVITMGCCRGVKGFKPPLNCPNVIVHDGYGKEEISEIRELINNKKVKILQWKNRLEEI